jgi:hypothetical protein
LHDCSAKWTVTRSSNHGLQLRDNWELEIFVDGHVKTLKLAATALPNDLWDSRLSFSDRVAIVQQMQPEYR